MTEMERLELENAVLRNEIADIRESILIGERSGEEEHCTLGRVRGALEYEEEAMRFAMENGEAMDYRLSARTLEDWMERFTRYEDKVILNDGMVIGFKHERCI